MTRVRRIARFLKMLARHPRIPKWVRVALAVCLFIPGPIDEALLFVFVAVLLVVRRDVITECWSAAA